MHARGGTTDESRKEVTSMTHMSLIATTALAICLALGGVPNARAADAALTGKVTSLEEGAMEGVVVSARKEGSTIRISVITDAEGQFSFPATKLDPGSYKISIRAAGYDLYGSGAADVVVGNKTTTTDLKLSKTRDLAAQLTNADW